MTTNGIANYLEVGGTGKVLQAMVKRINSEATTQAL
jgi:hypothetical protein